RRCRRPIGVEALLQRVDVQDAVAVRVVTLAGRGCQSTGERVLVEGSEAARQEVLPERLDDRAGPAGVRRVADGARRRGRELEGPGDGRREVRRRSSGERRGDGQGEQERLEAHHRYPFSWTRKVVVTGPWPQRWTTSARTSTCGNTNHHRPPHAPV